MVSVELAQRRKLDRAGTEEAGMWRRHEFAHLQGCRQTHPDEPIMTYEEIFVERQNARYAVGKGRFRGCC
jgi:hypothetical protein